MPVRYGVELDLPSGLEIEKIHQIRSASAEQIRRLKDPAEDVVGDLRIIRFLRTKKGDVAAATQWFTEFLTWRVTEQAPGGTPEDWRREVVGRSVADFEAWRIRRQNPYSPSNWNVGDNQDGMLLIAFAWGYNDPLKFSEDRHANYTFDDDFKEMVQNLEWVFWELTRRSRERAQMAYAVKLFDSAGWGEGGRQTLVNADKRWYDFVLKRQTGIASKFYCDHDAMFIGLNCPFSATLVWKVVRLFLTERQRSKAMIVGDIRKASKLSEVTEVWPLEFLPREYGGKLSKLDCVWPPPAEFDVVEFRSKRHLVQPDYPFLADSAMELVQENKEVENDKYSEVPQPIAVPDHNLDIPSNDKLSSAELNGPFLQQPLEEIDMEPVDKRCFQCC